jgi:hypothetical protein
MPDKKFQDIVSAAENPEIVRVVKERKGSVSAVFVGEHIVLRAGTEKGPKNERSLEQSENDKVR